MWNLPGPGIEPMSPALSGGLLTNAPPGKSYHFFIHSPVHGHFGCFHVLAIVDSAHKNDCHLFLKSVLLFAIFTDSHGWG